tara:strand:+ start:212 stop:418 length:207 start_codon:yes stop_codon:yes gene_type:complete
MIEVYNENKEKVFINPRYIKIIVPCIEASPYESGIIYTDDKIYYSDKTPKEVVNQIVAFNRRAHLQIT